MQIYTALLSNIPDNIYIKVDYYTEQCLFDNGLRRTAAFLFSKDIGRLAENLVFLELLRRGYEVHYWKDKREVDFIAQKEGKEVKYMKVRKAILAGSWYPAGASECEREINNFLNDATVSPSSKNKLTGGIVPHAGWYYSGSIACNVINCLKKGDSPDVFVIFGMHLGPESPCYIMKEGIWETPFGDIQIEKEIAGELVKRFNFNVETPEYFTEDNTIELQLPFIKYLFEDAKIVPIGVPPVKESLKIGRAAADISTRLGLNIKVIGSTDLTHYGLNYGFMPEGIGHSAVDWVRKVNDKRIIEIMLKMDPDKVISEALKHQNACCSGAAATAIAAAKQLGADHAESIVYATSYDKRPSDSFVGYAGIVF